MSSPSRTVDAPAAKPGVVAKIRELLTGSRVRTAVDELERAHSHRRNTL